MSQAAIAGEHAAKAYGLEVLQRGINDSGINSTRFIIVTNQKIFRKDAGKISICFEVPHKSLGSLPTGSGVVPNRSEERGHRETEGKDLEGGVMT